MYDYHSKEERRTPARACLFIISAKWWSWFTPPICQWRCFQLLKHNIGFFSSLKFVEMLQMYSQWCKSTFCASALTDPLHRLPKTGVPNPCPDIVVVVDFGYFKDTYLLKTIFHHWQTRLLAFVSTECSPWNAFKFETPVFKGIFRIKIWQTKNHFTSYFLYALNMSQILILTPVLVPVQSSSLVSFTSRRWEIKMCHRYLE